MPEKTDNDPLSKKTAFVFSGIGAQWKGMGAELFATEPVFRETIRACDEFFSQYANWSIVEQITTDAAHSRVDESVVAHPCNFALQMALVRLLESWGIRPDAVTGHSSGEVAAACTAGVLDLEDAIKVAWNHCLLMEQVRHGANASPDACSGMTHIGLPLADVEEMLAAYPCVDVAAANSPQATVVAGHKAELEEMLTAAKAKGVFCRMLRIEVPFHSRDIGPHLGEFHARIADIRAHAPQIPVYSSCYGALSPVGYGDAAYWPKHIAERVEFTSAIRAMVADGIRVFIEIGPHPVVSSYLHECVQDFSSHLQWECLEKDGPKSEASVGDCLIVSTLKRHEKEKACLLSSLALLHVSGHPIPWERMSPEDQEIGLSFCEALKGQAEKDASEVAAHAPVISGRVTAEAIQDWLLDRLSMRLNIAVSEMDVRQPLVQYGLDSMTVVRLSGELADWLGRPVSPVLLYSHPTIQALSEHLAQAEESQRLPGDKQQTTSHKRQATSHEPIAIIGMGCRFPSAKNPHEFWQLLHEGRDAITEVPASRWDVDAFYDPNPGTPGKMNTRWGGFLEQVADFDPQFFGISPTEANHMDPQQRLLLEVSWETLENASVAPDQLAGQQTGVFVGISTNDYAHLQSKQGEAAANAYTVSGTAFSVVANRLSYLLDLHGPSLSMDTACSSSLVAVHQACASLRLGESDLALAGGVNVILTPEMTLSFSQAGMMASDGRCKTFDARADGYVRGEGCGMILLKRLSDAERDGDPILAIIRGSAINQDGRTNGLTAPNGVAQQAVVRQAFRNADVEPAQVDYVEAHGTGTALGDSIEVSALKDVLLEGRTDDQPCWIGSVKTNIGHLEAASGIAGLIKVVLSFQHGEIFPHLHLNELNPLIHIAETPLSIPTDRHPHPPRFAGISSFGFGGANAHVVLAAPGQEPEPNAERQTKNRELRTESPEPPHLLTLSAKSDQALSELAKAYEAHLKSDSAPVADICHTAGVGRSHFDHRLAIVAESREHLREQLERLGKEHDAYGMPGVSMSKTSSKPPKIAFLFTGQGSQYVGMGRQLHETQPTFRKTLDQCDAILQPHLGRSILDIIGGRAGSGKRPLAAPRLPRFLSLSKDAHRLWMRPLTPSPRSLRWSTRWPSCGDLGGSGPTSSWAIVSASMSPHAWPACSASRTA